MVSPWRIVLRSLLVQGSWNYRTLQGTGFAWALRSDGTDPAEGRTAGSPAEGEAAASRTEVFNAHPYLATVALGAVAAARDNGASPEQLARFQEAVRAPLGSLGDRLIWGAWRPACLLLALASGLLGVPPLWIAVSFLVIYNTLHVALRFQGAVVGLRMGLDVAPGIREMGLGAWAERTERVGVLLLGAAAGLAAVATFGVPSGGGILAGAGVAALVGFMGGESLQRWVPLVLLVLVASGFALHG